MSRKAGEGRENIAEKVRKKKAREKGQRRERVDKRRGRRKERGWKERQGERGKKEGRKGEGLQRGERIFKSFGLIENQPPGTARFLNEFPKEELFLCFV